MNKALLDTDILSAVGKGIDQTVAHDATACRNVYGFLTLSVISVMQLIQGYQQVGGSSRIQEFRDAIASEQILFFDQFPPAFGSGMHAGTMPGSRVRIRPPSHSTTANSRGLAGRFASASSVLGSESRRSAGSGPTSCTTRSIVLAETP